MKRVRFFSGQILGAEDFQAEQQYHMEKRRLHNRFLHGFGVVDGLDVSVDAGEGTAVVVSPGLALDRLGNEILLEGPVRIELAPCAGEVCLLTLEFSEAPTDPVPVLTTDEAIEFSRVTEGYVVRIANEGPSPAADNPPVEIGRLIHAEGRWIVDQSYAVKRCR